MSKLTVQRRRSLVAGLGLALLLVCSGCQSRPRSQPPLSPFRAEPGPPDARKVEIDPTKIPTRDDIVQIVQYWPHWPWLRQGDRVVGFRVPVYFRSAETGKGAFVSGHIFAWVYELVPTPDGGRERKLAHVWEFSAAEAMGFRVRKRAIGGYYYGFILRWPEELTLEGKHIEVQFGYERQQDKRVVLGAPRTFRVPIPIGYRPPRPAEK